MSTSAPSANESTDKMMRALIEHLPGLTSITNSLVQPTATAQAQADAAAAPIYAQSNLDLYDKYGAAMNKMGADIDRANQLAASETEKQIAQGTGKELVTTARELQGILDPEWEALRQQIGAGIGNLITGMGDPNKLSEGEMEALRRGSAAGGFKNPNSAADSAASAMTFGNALNQRQDRFNQAFATMAGAIPNLRSGYSGFEVATRRALTPNTGEARVGTTPQGAGNQAYNMSSNLMNATGNFVTQRNSKYKDWMDRAQQMMDIVNKPLEAAGGMGGMAAAF